jgi:phosphatidylglycerophosphate synthase
MQAIVTIPDWSGRHDAAEQMLFHDVGGVPLLIRAIATATRAGADEALLIFPGFIPCEIVKQVRENKIFSALPLVKCISVRDFDPAAASAWQQISSQLQDEFFWIPWNWVTNKRALVALPLLAYEPASWNVPARLRRDVVMNPTEFLFFKGRAEGIAVLSEDSIDDAERWLVANSGKPLDGIYTSFNRWLCRPTVNALTHTTVSPNAVTLAGLLVACLSAYCYSRGSYLSSVAGALLFFLSGLFDEIDGMLARIKFSDSAFGTWFEGLVDNLSYLLLFGGIAMGLSRYRGPREMWIGGAIQVGAVISTAAVAWLRKSSTHRDRPNEYLGKMYRKLDEDRSNRISRISRNIEFLLKKGVFIHYVVLFSLLGLLPLMMRIAAIAANLTWILALYFKRRFFRSPYTGSEAVAFQKTAKVNA